MKTFHIDGHFVPASAVAYLVPSDRYRPSESQIWNVKLVNGSEFVVSGVMLEQMKAYFGICALNTKKS